MTETEKTYKGGFFQDLMVAVMFLTRLPLRADFTFSMNAVGKCSRFFPLAGFLIGGLAGVVYLISDMLGLPDLASAFLALTTQVMLTGALHEDALGDVADGFGGGHNKERKLEIMRDSRVGTYAVVALILSLGLKAALIAHLENPVLVLMTLIAAASCSRGWVSWAMHLMPKARQDGLGADAGKPALTVILQALALSLLIPILLQGPFSASVGLIASILGAMIMAAIAYRQIGGQTGDVLGSIQQVSEICYLLGIAVAIQLS